MLVEFARPDAKGLAFIFLFLFLVFYCFSYEPYSTWVSRSTFDLLPGDDSPLRIVFISDIHAATLPEGRMHDIVSRVNALNPDIVLIGGDTIDASESEFGSLAPLAGLAPKMGSFAVLGNHDYGYWGCGNMGIGDKTEARLEELGIKVLRNGNIVLRPEGRGFALIGVDDDWSCMDDYAAASGGIDDATPKIILVHNTGSINAEEVRGNSLVLAGHTHCGQVRVPFVTELAMGSGFGSVLGGRARMDHDTEAYVTCGLTPGGVRFNAPPEISVIEIV